jgi:hypothetical protein
MKRYSTNTTLALLVIAFSVAALNTSLADHHHHRHHDHGPLHGPGSSHNPIAYHPVHGPGSSHDPIVHTPVHGPGSSHDPIVCPPTYGCYGRPH